MLNLIPLPYRILLLVAFAAAIFGIGFSAGGSHNQAKTDAAKLKLDKVYAAEAKKQVAIVNALSGRLAAAEGTIVTKTVEVIKYVPKFTTGRLCLDAGAVSLLQPGSVARINPAPRKPTSEDASPSASDTDIAYWVATANKEYETCAERLSTLIDAVRAQTPENSAILL